MNRNLFPPPCGCPTFRDGLRVTRRQFLTAGNLGLWGLTLPALFHAEASAARPPRARSVILLNCFGGPSHLDLWDMKPDGPSAIRGPFATVCTRLPGTVYCEHLPQLAGRNDKYTLVRSVTHERIVHGGAVGFVL